MNDIATKLRKFGAWLWNQKEKMVLFVLVVFLCYRVYVVGTQKIEFPPGQQVSGAGPEPPGEPPVRPPMPRPAEFQGLVARNPFSVYGVTPGEGGSSGERTTFDDVQLIRIVEWSDGGYRAEMRDKGGKERRWEQGEKGETFEIRQIDPQSQTVTLFSYEFGREFTLTTQTGG